MLSIKLLDDITKYIAARLVEETAECEKATALMAEACTEESLPKSAKHKVPLNCLFGTMSAADAEADAAPVPAELETLSMPAASEAFPDLSESDTLPDLAGAATFHAFAEAEALPGLNEKLKTLDESFTEMLFRKIDEQGISDADCYHSAQLNRSHFNKIKNDPGYHVQKETVIALALALKLDRPETNEMLTKAGFALSPSSKADLIIEYCIAHNIYDVTEVNQILYSFDQKLLGAGIRE